MAYKHNDALHKHQKRVRRLRIFTLIFVMIIGIGSIVVAVDWILNNISNTETVVSSENTKSVQAANISVFRTEYFSFQATDDWVLIDQQSSDNVFTYLKNADSTVDQRMVFYVNLPETTRVNQNISRLLPIEISSSGDFIPIGSVSDHCDTSWPTDLKRNPNRIEHQGISMECTPNTQEYNIILGQYEKSDRIEVTRSSGESMTLTIVYSDLTAYPTPGDLYNIVSSLRIL